MLAGTAGTLRFHASVQGIARINTNADVDSLLIARVDLTALTADKLNVATGETLRASLPDFSGPVVLQVSGSRQIRIMDRGRGSSFLNAVGVQQYFRRLIGPLPGRSIRLGQTWKDTIEWEETTEEALISVREIISGQYIRDTVVMGRTLNVLHTQAEQEIQTNGLNEHMEVRRNLRGDAARRLLWDPVRRIVIASEERVRLNGIYQSRAINNQTFPMHVSSSLRIRIMPPK